MRDRTWLPLELLLPDCLGAERALLATIGSLTMIVNAINVKLIIIFFFNMTHLAFRAS
ncbi:MAG: hypothetical protein ACYSTX_05320 [Planctomycetota bacterium]